MPKLPLAKIANRIAAGQAVAEVAKDNPDIWVLTADVMQSTATEPFAHEFPDRFINVGVAEQTMMGLASGLATCGKIPFAATFAFLAAMRSCEQVRTDIDYPNLNVKIYATHSGVALGQAGTTHHATEDIAIMRAMSNMTIVAPADAREIQKVVAAAVAQPGPVYIRLRRGPDPIVYAEDFEYQIGQANMLRQGSDVTLIGCGRTVAECLIASELLASQGISARVLDMHTIKPIDAAAIEDATKNTCMILTVEEHNIIGGMGGAVAEVMAGLGSTTPLKRLGLQDVYAGIGPEEELLDKHGLTGPKIAGKVLSSLSYLSFAQSNDNLLMGE
jgi:transketolase